MSLNGKVYPSVAARIDRLGLWQQTALNLGGVTAEVFTPSSRKAHCRCCQFVTAATLQIQISGLASWAALNFEHLHSTACFLHGHSGGLSGLEMQALMIRKQLWQGSDTRAISIHISLARPGHMVSPATGGRESAPGSK